MEKDKTEIGMKNAEGLNLEGYRVKALYHYGEEIMVFYEKDKGFVSGITKEMEEPAKEGDLAILWNEGSEWKAVIAILEEEQKGVRVMDEYAYRASNQEWFQHAIKYRSVEQFGKIVRYRPEKK